MNDIELNALKKELAHTMVKFGLNLKKDESVAIYSTIEAPEFAAMLVEECYLAGAKRVHVNWSSSATKRLDYLYGKKEDVSHYLPYEINRLEYEKEQKSAILVVSTTHFNEFKGVNLKKVNAIQNSLILENMKHSNRLYFDVAWSSFFIPSKDWAHKLFPTLDIDKALKKSWELFLKVTRVEKDKTEENWEKHLKELDRRKKWLDSLNLKTLHYTSKNGTDLTIGLIDEGIWCGGSNADNSGRLFCPNFPTEEVFASPHRDKVNGVVYSTKPLSYEGKIIDGIKIEFKDGKIVHCSAKKNYKLLKNIISTDEGSHYLGEVALVPFDSLINKARPTFYSTIYDENACCHLAIGLAFPFSIKNFVKKDRIYFNSIGLNYSNTHVDFMIGSNDLNIEGTTRDGKKVWIFKNGTWAK